LEKNQEFIKLFWEYIDNNNGFSKCPTCGNIPIVLRSRNYDNMRFEGLFKLVQGTSIGSTDCGRIDSIQCCEHLYDFTNKKRYILSEKYQCPGKEKVKFYKDDLILKYYRAPEQMKNKVGWPEYVEYIKDDPYGIKSKKLYDISETQNKILSLEKELSVLNEKLLNLTND
jgi:hypothetical protein